MFDKCLDNQKLCISINTYMSQTLPQTFRFFVHISRCVHFDLDVLYGFANQNLIRKTFLLVRGVKIAVIGGGWFGWDGILSFLQSFQLRFWRSIDHVLINIYRKKIGDLLLLHPLNINQNSPFLSFSFFFTFHFSPSSSLSYLKTNLQPFIISLS